MATYLNMDPTLVRVLTVVLTLFTGVPVVVYLVLLLVVPEEGSDTRPNVPPGYSGGASQTIPSTKPHGRRSGLGAHRCSVGAASTDSTTTC